MRSWKKLRGGPINQDNKISRGETAHNPIESKKWNPNLNQNESDKGPIHMIKCLDEIQFEYEGTNVFSFNRVENLLNNSYRLNDLSIFKEA